MSLRGFWSTYKRSLCCKWHLIESIIWLFSHLKADFHGDKFGVLFFWPVMTFMILCCLCSRTQKVYIHLRKITFFNFIYQFPFLVTCMCVLHFLFNSPTFNSTNILSMKSWDWGLCNNTLFYCLFNSPTFSSTNILSQWE